MIDAGVLRALTVAAALLPALVWSIVAHDAWRFLRVRRPRSTVFRLLPLMAASAALFYALAALYCLLPPHDWEAPTIERLAFYVASDWSMLACVALARHALEILTAPHPPGRRWCAINYGSALAVAGFSLVFPSLVPGETYRDQVFVYFVVLYSYVAVTIGLIMWQMSRMVRRGGWWPAGPNLVARRADLAVFAGGLAGVAVFLALLLTGGVIEEPLGRVLLTVLASWGFAVPLAVRKVGQVIRGVVLAVVMTAAAAAVYFGAPVLAARFEEPWLQRLVDLGALAALVALVVPGQAWLRRAIDRIVFRRSRRHRAELQAFLHALSPDLGRLECARCALRELVRVRELRGAAVLFRGDETVVEGTLATQGLLPVWRELGTALPSGAILAGEFLELPRRLREALVDAEVVAVVPIATPRQHAGHLLMTTGLLGITFDEEEVEAMEAFADQLARVLDGADLLARAVAVERSLAHAEKLAAVGETAARIAHEIRNPVTAARSLAQQLAREPGSPFVEELALILVELERVERQVADLLRFSRREELRLEPVDLAALARATVGRFRPRLDAAAVQVALDAPAPVEVAADREKLGQVLINLVENAIDALDERPDGVRRLALAIAAADGSASISVSDTGPGVVPGDLPRLFEPFFSRKAHGTGLGLAIVKRTVDAHGGHIEATRAAGGGMTFRVVLPRGGPVVVEGTRAP